MACKKAKEFFIEKNIEFREIVLDDNEAGIEKMRRLTDGGMTVPVIQIKNVLIGHHPRKFEKLMEFLKNW